MQHRGNVFGRALGRLNHLQLHAKALGQSWVRGLRKAELLYRCSRLLVTPESHPGKT